MSTLLNIYQPTLATFIYAQSLNNHFAFLSPSHIVVSTIKVPFRSLHLFPLHQHSFRIQNPRLHPSTTNHPKNPFKNKKKAQKGTHRRKSRSTGSQTIFRPTTFPSLSFFKSQLYCNNSSNSQFLRFPSNPFRWVDLALREASEGREAGEKGRRGGVIFEVCG